MKHPFVRTLVAASVSLALAVPAQAALERLGPVNNSPTVGGFPAWVQDKSGVAIEFCDMQTQSELDGGWCTLIPPGPIFPEHFPDNYFIEHFYSDAVSVLTDGTTRARLVIAMEASFGNGFNVVPGDQMIFGRIRVFLTNLPFSGTYTIYHPYGTWIFPDQVAGDRIFFTEDVGLACIGTFTCALDTAIGPFLLPSATPGGAEVPPIPDIQPGQDPFYDILVNTGGTTTYPGTGKKYVADPGRIGPVTGSPLAPFVGNDGVTYNHNIFRIEGPNGFVLSSDSDFTLNGRLFTGAMPGNVTTDRASYAQNVAGSTTGKKLDVFATGQPTSQARIPALPAPPKVTPSLTFFDAPCAGTIDPTTGATLPPFSQPANASETQMTNADTRYWGQAHPSLIPTAVCVKDATSRNGAGQIVPTFYNLTVTDETTQPGGSTARYDSANGGSLTVSAQSSDNLTPPVLTLAGYGATLTGSPPSVTISPLAAPPAKVTVMSAEGSSADMLVQTAVGGAGGGTAPLANNDTFTIFEDCSATAATACATPFTFNPLANDTLNGGPIPAGAIVTITGTPRLGSVTQNGASMTYTPNANVNGTELIAYTVTVNGAVSNAGNITINITPVNDLPVAVNDVSDAVVSKLNKVNVLANDTDADGTIDLANARIVSWPTQLGVQPVPAAGVVSFTPISTGTFSFTYNAVDASGAVSAAPATATVNVLGSEAITIAKALFKFGNQGGATSARWVVSGTDSVREGQTITVAYNNGTLTAAQGGGTCNGSGANPKCVVGTAVVDGLGNYVLDQTNPPGGLLDPTDGTVWNVKPTSVKVFSSSPVLGGSQTAPIVNK
jgi:cadherin-like protein